MTMMMVPTLLSIFNHPLGLDRKTVRRYTVHNQRGPGEPEASNKYRVTDRCKHNTLLFVGRADRQEGLYTGVRSACGGPRLTVDSTTFELVVVL